MTITSKIYCKKCQHFRQHYAFLENRFTWVDCGHCTLAKPKRKRAFTRACDQFVQKTGASGPDLTKRYLSIELLKFVLSLELPPKIEGEPDEGKG